MTAARFKPLTLAELADLLVGAYERSEAEKAKPETETKEEPPRKRGAKKGKV